MSNEQLIQQLMATFLEELQEHVVLMNQRLLEMEKQPPNDQRAELLQELFRSAHSLKGAARAVSVEVLETACHQLEDLLGELREGQRKFTSPLASLLLNTVDAIEEVGRRLRDQQDISATPLDDLIPILKSVSDGQEPPLPETSSPPIEPPSLRDVAVPTSLPPAEPPVETSPAEASPAEASPVANAQPHTPAAATVRVPAEKLDSLLAQSGELLVARRRVEFRVNDASAMCDSAAALGAEWRELERPLRRLCEEGDGVLPRRAASMLDRAAQRIAELAKGLELLASQMQTDSRLLGQTCSSLDDEVYRVRMLPFAEACGGLERTVRDLCQLVGKEVELVIEGGEVEVDRSVLEGLRAPLLHLVRNAVDHGIETPELRRELGKPSRAQVVVSAALRGGQLEVVVADDGRGFDLRRIREKAAQQGMAVPEEERELAQLVFSAGFSTAPIVTDVSGRGVGLDVVQSQIESLRGVVDVSFVAGVGSRFILTAPLTLTTVRCLLASACGQTYALPTSSVRRIVRFEDEQVRTLGGRDVLLLGEAPTPLASLATVLGLPAAASRSRAAVLENKATEGGNPGALAERPLAVVLTSGPTTAAVMVDEVVAEQEVLVKNLGPRIRRLGRVSGATLLPTGEAALVLNTANVVRAALEQRAGPRGELRLPTARPTAQKRLLAVDDSLTTRALMKGVLESAGYDVSAAIDGEQAWEMLQNETFDVVISDVDMPRMNGFQLTSAIRNSSRHAALPVVLVTARGSDEDKKQGLQVGANAYLIKSGFDQKSLLEVIEQLT